MNHNEQDPWTWGYEDNITEDSSHNEWNAWNSSSSVTSDLNKKNKQIPNQQKHQSNQGPDYFDTVNLRHTSHNIQPDWPQGDSAQTNYGHYTQQSNVSNYFNNNCQTDVENKEVAPPDNQYNRNTLQPSLPKEQKLVRHLPEQMTALTSQFNQNVQLPAPAGSSASGPLLGLKGDQEDRSFRHMTQHSNPMFCSVPNAPPISSIGPPYSMSNNHSKNASSFFPPPPLSNEMKPRYQVQPGGQSEWQSQKQYDSNHSLSGPHSLPMFSSNSAHNNSPHLNNVPTQEKPVVTSSLFSSSDNMQQNQRVQTHDVHNASQQEIMKFHFTQQNTSNKEQMLNTLNPSTTSIGDLVPGHFSNSDAKAEGHSSLPSNQEVKSDNRTSSSQSHFTHKPVEQCQDPYQSSIFQPPLLQSNIQQDSVSQNISLSQEHSIPQQSHTPQHLLVSQESNTIHHQQEPPKPLSYSQHPPMTHQEPKSLQQPPTSQQFSFPHNPLVSQESTVIQSSRIQHQSPPENPPNPPTSVQSMPSYAQPNAQQNPSQNQMISFQLPVSQYLTFSQQSSINQQPLYQHLSNAQQQANSHQSLTYQHQDSHKTPPPPQQPQVSHSYPESVESKNFTSNSTQITNFSQEITHVDSQLVQDNSLKSSQPNSCRDLNFTSADECQSINIGLSMMSNIQNNDKNKDNANITNLTRNTPSPQQLPRSQTPSNTAPTTSSMKFPNTASNVLSLHETKKEIVENVPFDYETHSYNGSTSRNQISFSFQNVHPVASSSPVPVQNVPENLERLPENHELPDNTENLLHDMKNLSLNREVENDTQIHCQVDRNQYLETGHLSGSKDHILTDNSPNVEAVDESEAPPPGLHRLVTGQGCETRGPLNVGDHPLVMIGAESTAVDDNRQSSRSSSTAGSDIRNAQNGPVGESESHARTGRLVQGQSIGDDTDGIREVPGEATPFQNRIVLGQMGRGITPPLIQDTNTTRGDNTREREIVGRMVLGERHERDMSQTVGSQDDFRQSHRSLRRSRRGESSYEDEDHDYPSDRDRRVDEYKRRGEDRAVRHRNRREHRSPEYRSDEEFEERRGFTRMGRSERRPRDFSPDYYNSSYYREDHRRHRRYEHYRDYDDDYYYRENRSRPSSRTGSDYRRFNMDYSYGRVNPKQMLYPDLMSGSIPFNPRAPEEYYEAMRRLDPVGYAAWYNQYMSSRRFNVQQNQSTYNNDRASVHSGQSSTNNQRPNAETPQLGMEEVGREDDFVPSPGHTKGIIDNCCRLIVIDPHFPMENQRQTVQFYNISKLASDPDLDEFLESPGPFVSGITHRNTVLQYLKWISDKTSKSSEKLLYDLIQLIVKSNGELNGLDVADLLMESYRKSQRDEGHNISEPVVEQISSAEALIKFRELLQQGNKTEALDWAIDREMWGHAFFLASKMNERSHNNIMLRFANSIPHTDPLQTLYQLMSGHVPQASTCCADKKWSDWRPHLAMILGNPTGNVKLDRKAITKLGDSLYARGRIFASHFCYITAQVEFTNYHQDAKLVLLGSSTNQEFSQFASCRAIMLTICYEYGLKLRHANANIPSLQLYKLILATRLVDCGKPRIALQYCELVANEAVLNECCERPLIASVIDLSSKLKMLDPTLALTGDVEADPDWLAKLKNFYEHLPEDYDAGFVMKHGVSSSTVSEVGQEIPFQQEKNEINDTADRGNNFASEPMLNNIEYSIPSAQLPPQNLQPPYSGQSSLPPEILLPEDQHQSYQPSSLPPLGQNTYSTEPYPQQSAIEPYWGTSNGIPPSNTFLRQDSVENTTTTTATNMKNNFFKASEEQLKLNDINKDNNRSNKKGNDKPAKTEENQHGGWFGGIWEKFSIRPKNQMRLPDDNNPSIVWDEKKKKWVNLEGDDEGQNLVKPPPRMVETAKPQPIPSENIASVPPPGGNKYKIQKGKLMKSNYVNIMGSTNTNQPNPVRPMDGLFPTPQQPSNTNFFVPPPAEGSEYSPIDFINPGTVAANNNQTEGGMDTKQEFPQGIAAPSMYNPARYPISNDC